MKKALLKDSIKEIKKTYKRFISILLMALLGVGFFAGVRATSPDMKLTIDKYFDKQNVYDVSVISTLGLTDDDIEAISKIEGVEKAVGIYTEDVYVTCNEEEIVVKAFELQEGINDIEILEGNTPKNSDECIIEEYMKTADGIKIGDYIEIRENLDEDEESSFKNTKLKVVGIGKSPLYIAKDRGTTTLGNGKLSYYIYIHKDNINTDIYTEIDIIAKNAKENNTLDTKYKTIVSELEDDLEKIKNERQVARYEQLIQEANQELDDAQKEFDAEKKDAEEKIKDAESEISKGKKEIRDAEKKLSNAEKELKDGKATADTEFANAQSQIEEAQNNLTLAQEKINEGWIQLETSKNEANEGIKQIQDGIKQIDETSANLSKNKTEIENALVSIEQIKNIITSKNEEVKLLEDELQNSDEEVIKEELVAKINSLNTEILELENQKSILESSGITEQALEQINSALIECATQKSVLEKQIKDINKEIANAENTLNINQNQILTGREELEKSKNQLEQSKIDTAKKFEDAEKEIRKGKKELSNAKKELADGEKELEDKKTEFNEEIAKAEQKLIDAREQVNDIEVAKWYIQNRNGNTAFNSFSQDTENIEKLGDIFPIVFFIIATLISLTSMSRMVEEQRVQIGTLKALGYNKFQIMSKYIIYSLTASAIGGFLGATFGLYFFPTVIISMYQMMYDLNELVIEFNEYYTVLGMGIMCLCIVGATMYTASKELASTPSEMMRPKAPRAGKRVLLERIPFIWSKFNFSQKVTLRNMFRYKKRFLMTIIGIMGCTALILAGFGLKDSVSKIMDYQYIDVYNYDMMISLKNTLTEDEITSLISELENKEQIEHCERVYMSSNSVQNLDFEEDAQIIVTNNPESLDKVIRLKELKTGDKIELNDNGVILTDKLAQLLNAKIGDEIILCDSDNNQYKVKVGGITEHYISHYVYMTETLYKKVFNDTVSTNVLFTQYTNDLTEDEQNKLSKEILLNSKVMAVTLTEYLMNMMNDTLEALNFVVYVLVISAGLLAFIVLYNLSNVNISERIRELATIKVLGFYDKEVYNYITREIILLTIIGILVGLLFGNVLNSFILGTCEIGMLRFKKIILLESYIYSALITIVFTYIINFMTYFSLKKINMIESLKSVE